MRIAHIVSDISRAGWGVSRVTEHLSAAQIKCGAEAQVFGHGGKQWEESDADLWQGGPANPVMLIGPRSFGYSPFLIRKIVAWRPDVLHLHGIWTYHAYAALRAQLSCEIPMLISPHGMLAPIALEYSGLKKKLVSKLYQDEVFSNATAFHATSQAEVNDIMAYGIDKPIHIIPNGVEVVDKPHGILDKQKKRVLSLGRLHHKKGLNRLIEAWSLIEKDFDDWSLHIVGTDSKGYRKILKKQISDLNLQNVVIKDGVFGLECDKLIAGSDIFAVPTLSESWPLSVGQALMLEVPVIATKGAPFPELIEKGCGDWVDHGSDAMAKALVKMMSLSSNDRKIMGRLGRQWVLSELSWMSIADRFIGVYNQLK